jgi:phospholipid/cholesterol/gamma-HCH transport system substrate-binding protein
MKHEHINYAVVGAFVLVIALGFVFIIAYITGQAGQSDSYHVFYKTVTGVQYGTPVTYEGFKIGQVEEVLPVRRTGRTWYRVNISVRKDWKIPTDSLAVLVASGLLARVTIDISEGSHESYLDPGEEIKGKELFSVFNALTSMASDVNKLTENSIRPLIERLYQGIDVLASALENHAPEILHNFEELALSLNKNIVRDIEITAQELRQSAQLLQRVLGDKNRYHISRFLKNMDKTSENLKQLSENLKNNQTQLDNFLDSTNKIVHDNQHDIRQSMIDLRMSLQTVSYSIDSIAYNLESASQHMNEFSQQIRHNPSLLLGSKPPVDKK